LDRWLELADVEKSWANRVKIYQKIENILFSEIPAFPLFSNQQRIAMQPNVKGVKVPPLGFNYLEARKIWFDK
jgi:ABC-type transport system substrate-binding protein